VHDPLTVRAGQRVQKSATIRAALAMVNAPERFSNCASGSSRDIGHTPDTAAFMRTEVIQRNDIGMLQILDSSRFAPGRLSFCALELVRSVLIAT